MVWYSHLLKHFPQFVVIHTVKGFSLVNKAEVDVFLEFSCFSRGVNFYIRKETEREEGKVGGDFLSYQTAGKWKEAMGETKRVDLGEGRDRGEGVDGCGAEARAVDAARCRGPRRAEEEGAGQQEGSPAF